MDHIFLSLTGSWGRNINALAEGRLGGGDLTDTPVAQRVVKSPYRSSRTAEKYWNDMAQEKGVLATAERSFAYRYKRDGIEGAMTVLNREDSTDRADVYAISQALHDGFNARHHPMRWADDMRSEVIDPLQEIIKTSERLEEPQRNAIVDELDAIQLWMQRAALNITDHPDFADDELDDVEMRLHASFMRLRQLNEATYRKLLIDMQGQYARGDGRKYPSYAEMKRGWPQMRRQALALRDNPAALSAALEDKD